MTDKEQLKKKLEEDADRYTDSLLRIGFSELAQSQSDSLHCDVKEAENEIKISPQLRKKYKRLISKELRQQKRMKKSEAATPRGRLHRKAAVVLLAAIICMTGIVYANELHDLLLQLFPHYAVVGSTKTESTDREQKALYPTYLPDGYVKREPSLDYGSMFMTEYDNGESHYTLTQYNSQTNESVLDRENAQITYLYVGRAQAILIEKNGIMQLSWGESPCFLLEGPANLGQETYVKIAESVPQR